MAGTRRSDGGGPATAMDCAEILRRRGALTVGEAARVGAAAARALRARAAQGEAHGDVRPGTILVSEQGEVDLHAAEAGSPASADHLSPEQARGEPPSPASDLYGLGSTLFHLVAARPPFRRAFGHVAPEKLAERHQTGEAPDLALTAPGVEPAFAELCGRLMAREPAERPGHDEVIATLAALAEDLSASIPRSEAPSSTGGRTAFLAATAAAPGGRATRDERVVQVVKWVVAIAVLALAVAWLVANLP